MTLRDVSGFHHWIESESPSQRAWSVVRTFLAEVGERPWVAPSIPVVEMSNQPDYELRTAVIEVDPGIEVQVWWINEYATGAVDVVGVTFL